MRHLSRPATLIMSLACLALGPAVLADDVVHFQNGTFMKVQGYTVEGDTIKVSLGPGASMSFPKTLVESIERAGQTVYSSSGPANVVVSGAAGGAGSAPYLASSEQMSIHHRAAAEGGSGEGDVADKDAAASRADRTAFQVSPNRGQIRALGRRAGPLGEALVSKDPTAQPPNVQNPRGFTSISAKGAPEPGVIGPVATPPAEVPSPVEAEPPQEEPAAEEDGGN